MIEKIYFKKKETSTFPALEALPTFIDYMDRL